MPDKKQYLFLFSISPVQSFIAQARKTQDLYAGSRILSELAKIGLKEANKSKIQDNYIFPNNPDNTSVPNRFLCIIETNDPKEYGSLVEEAVRDEWNNIASTVLNFTNIKGIKEQIDAHLDINWAFQEIKPDYSDYKDQYEKIERLLGAVKNARSFTQFNYQTELGEKGRKCSLDGERNVKFYRLTEQEQREKDGKVDNKNAQSVFDNKLFSDSEQVFINPNVGGKFPLKKLQPGEGLSAVSMVKRDFDTKIYLSTADIAMFHVVKNLFTSNMVEICNYRNEFAGFEGTEFNAQLYFEENLNPSYFKKQGYGSISDKIDGLKKQLSKLNDLSERNGFKFCKYYAIIDFDGDEMGKWLSGVKINNPETNLKEFHSKLSEKLALFAKEAKRIVNEYGQTVYAGGDDFLGFVNLNYLFTAMKELRDTFEKEVNKALHDELKYLNSNLSFSAGVCIAHYKEPLSIVLDKAAAAQKTAKHDEKGKRNAFTIVASKHSGENHATFFKWGNDCSNVSKLQHIVNQLISDNCYSNTFIKNLTIEFSRLVDNDEKLKDDTLLRAETYRLVKRSNMFKRDYDKGETKEAFDDRKKQANITLTDIIIALLVDRNFNNFINALHICDFMHRLLSSDEAIAEKELQPQTIN